ncbi:hypothetical protein AL518_20060 [Hafnia paralvei]|uniref:hypothetical protein n=1 Tax=Hafnia paralvei TaxID=546367 RepID=UPI00076B7974|nr:hypothetical protein [Hafnia paralvei]AMH20087.1 hypothetical protein AL518_20060 [Hafnia paralvei]
MQIPKKYFVIFIVVVVILTVAPLITYGFNFPYPLSTKNSDWGDFGSFIGGLSGSLFSFLSLVIVLISLYLTQENGRKQLELQRSEQNTTEFNLLLDVFLDGANKVFQQMFTSRVGESPSHLFQKIGRTAYHYHNLKPSDFNEKIMSIASDLIYELYPGRLDNEVKLLSAILYRVNNSPKSLSEAYKIILISKLSNDYRFFIKAYIHKFSPDIFRELSQWDDFAFLPEDVKSSFENAWTNNNGRDSSS